MFLIVIKVLAKDYGISMDQRGQSLHGESRNQLSFAAKSGNEAQAVKAMVLDRGALHRMNDVPPRPEEGGPRSAAGNGMSFAERRCRLGRRKLL